MYLSIYKIVSFVLLFFVAGAAFADPMLVPADELPNFLAKHDKAVVLFTSPDPKCVFCTEGMRKNFTVLSHHGARQGLVYAVTQWSPWQNLPPVIQRYGINLLPQIVLFRNGKEVGKSVGYLKVEEWRALEAKVQTEFGGVTNAAPKTILREAPQFP
ncbi:hypothetical protein AB4090_13035 [Acidithiobacillus sp. IBUN Pt1247-S3]|uniref:hypothetical protein n=1 Tax=Acidithiobacillus sp. IBUN Pt1247-S3 TaxID=3166642 RepID=UPI0034E4C5D4